jgi:peptide/nickel transport system substrate-binding protein
MGGAALGGVGLAAIAAGCSSSTSKSTPTGNQAPAQQSAGKSGSPAAAQPRKGGTLNHSGGSEGSYDTQGIGFDPHTYLSIGGLSYRLFYQGLLTHDPRTYAVQPQLGQKWEQPDQNTYNFTLQPGVKWHNKPPANGREMTIEDIVYSLNRARTDEPRFFSRSVLLGVDKIEATDKTHLHVTTKSPDASMLAKFAADFLLMLNPETVEKAGKFATADTAVGTGAFILKSAQDHVNSEYTRNPDYWKPGMPYLDGLRTLDLKDEQAGLAAFQAGQVDIARVNGQGAKDFISKQGSGYKPEYYADNTFIHLWPQSKQKPMDDARVTQALRLLIDHEEMKTGWAEVWFSKGQHGSIFPTALQDWDLTEDEYKKHLEWQSPKDAAAKQAIQLLSAAGYSAANPLKFEVVLPVTPFLQAVAELAQAQWKKLSQGAVEATLKPVDIAIANSLRGQRQFTFMIHGSAVGATEPDSWLSEDYRSGASINFMNYSDPQFDAMIDKQRTIFDVNQRKAAVKDAIVYSIDHCPGVIPSNRYFFSAKTPKVRDWAPEFYINGDQYERVWLSA